MDSDYFPPLSLQIAAPGWTVPDAILCCVILCILLILACAIAAGGRALFALTLEELSEVREEKNPADRFLHLLSDRPQQTRFSLAAVQSLVTLAIGTVGLYGVALLWPDALRSAVGCVSVILVGSLLMCLCCGLVPRWLLRKGHLRVARTIAPVLKFIDFLCSPISRRLAVAPSNAMHRNEVTTGEPATILSKESADEHEMLEEIGQFYNKTADEIMVPRVDMKAISARCTFEEVFDLLCFRNEVGGADQFLPVEVLRIADVG